MNKAEQANSFLNIIRSIINEEQNKLDRVEICQIDSVNEDGTVNIKMLSDFESVRIIPNISNQSIYSFKSGDLAIIYMIQNQLSNAFIIAKCGPTNESLRISSSDGNTTGDGTVIQNITYQNVTASGVTSINGKTGEVTITAQDLGAITEIPDVTQIQSTDISSLVYDTINGAAFEINNSIIFSDGTENNSLLKFNLPIIGINGISIDKANGKNVLEISGKDLQDLINSISLTSGTNNGTLKLTVGTTIVDNIKVTGTVTGVKVNGTTKSPVDGVVDIGPVPTVVQTTGTSTTSVMSQNSVTNELNKKADLFVKETEVNQINPGKSYELGDLGGASSAVDFPTINATEFTSINDVSQICFRASANFVMNMPSTTYLCIGDGLSSDKTKLTTVSGKSYCITVGYTPFGIQIVSAIVDVL